MKRNDVNILGVIILICPQYVHANIQKCQGVDTACRVNWAAMAGQTGTKNKTANHRSYWENIISIRL